MENRTVTQTELMELIEAGQIFCQWFAACPRTATHLQPHPALTLVPCCDQCGEFANG